MAYIGSGGAGSNVIFAEDCMLPARAVGRAAVIFNYLNYIGDHLPIYTPHSLERSTIIDHRLCFTIKISRIATRTSSHAKLFRNRSKLPDTISSACVI